MTDDRRRYQVFVSSTYIDLRAARQHVTAALLECDAFPAGMELFPAADEDAWTLIRRVIDESDYYLLIIGGKYGSVDEIQELSYTEMEYNYAVSSKKPVMAFLHGSPEDMLVKDSEKSDKTRAKLETFRSKVEKQKHVKYWTTDEQLAGQVALTFNKFVRSYPAVGWVRADQATQPETLQKLTEAHTRIEQLELRLEATESGPPPGTEELARGDDELTLPVHIKFQYRKPNGVSTPGGNWVRVTTTWDAVFGAICPRLLDEAKEEALRESLQTFIEVDHYGFVESEIGRYVQDVLKDDAESVTIAHAWIDDEDLGTIVIQLVALGLIVRSSRKRSVNDENTYWTLTPYGSSRAIQLRALRRASGPSLSGSASQDVIAAEKTVDPADD